MIDPNAQRLIDITQHTDRRVKNMLAIIKIHTEALGVILRGKGTIDAQLIALEAVTDAQVIYKIMNADPWPPKVNA